MEGQVFFNTAVGLAAFLGGWVLNNISKAIERLDADVRKMPFDYVSKSDYQRDIDEMKASLREIYDLLRSKQDRREV